ncbi:MAG TPA: universal stress protein [Acidimicrobiales bacterium]|jgi:nucleotide-binding universal stress UspA family protein
MFDQILLAIDDSAASETAAAYAGALAARNGGRIHVFHVNEYLVTGGGRTLRTRDQASTLVTDAVLQLRETGVRVGGSACVASYRQVPNRIAAAALEHGADAIVLGSRRARRLGRLFSFQVRERVTRLTALPVLTAPSPLGRIPAGVTFEDALDQELVRLLTAPRP